MYLFIQLIFCSAFCFLAASTPIMPLSEVRVGMIGEWKTVVEGNQMRTYRLEILGVQDNFNGPDFPIIIAKALDPSQKESGPVGGMSGSPVYCNGKLIGAYAYGFTWSKNQALIGITPIENMLSVLDIDAEKNSPPRGSEPSGGLLKNLSKDFLPNSSWKAVPTPLMMGGFSTQSVEVFASEWRALGLNPVQAPIGKTQSTTGLPLIAGNPVAGIFSQGDFQMAGVGTVTWRSGDRILAFGHPFLRSGSCAMPMAKAEIVTIVQSLNQSFKLSQVALASGTIYQDRLAAIAGNLQYPPKMIPISIDVNRYGFKERNYRAELFDHQDFTPLIASTALLESIARAETGGGIRTDRVEANITFEDGSILEWSDLATGKKNAKLLSGRFLSWARRLWGNPFEEVSVKAISFQVESIENLRETFLERVLLSQNEVEPGKSLEVEVRLSSYRGEESARWISIKIPDSGLDTSTLQLHLLDASAAERLLRQKGAPLVDDWRTLLQDLSYSRSPDKMYLFLTQSNKGLHLDGTDLPGLPSSVQHLLSSDQWEQVKSSLHHEILWQSSIDFPGVFKGSYQTSLEINHL